MLDSNKNNSLQFGENLQISGEKRIQKIFSLLPGTSQQSFDALEFYLTLDPNPIVRHEAAYVLGEKKDKKAVPILIRTIQNDSNKFVIHEATLALANLGRLSVPESKPVIESLLSHKVKAVVDTAEIALQRLEMKLKDEILTSDPKDIISNLCLENREKRIQASFLLMEEASEEAVDTLITALHREPCDIVKHEIIFALGESISHKSVPELLKVLKYEKRDFSLHESLLALATLGDESAVIPIKSFFSHKDPNISETAKIAYERIQS